MFALPKWLTDIRKLLDTADGKVLARTGGAWHFTAVGVLTPAERASAGEIVQVLGSLDSEGVYDGATLAAIDAVRELGWPDYAIWINVIRNSGIFSLPSLSLRPVTTTTLISGVSVGSFLPPEVVGQLIVTVSSLNGVQSDGITLPSASLRPVVTVTFLNGVQVGLITSSSITVRPTVVTPSILGDNIISSGSFTLPSLGNQLSVSSLSLSGVQIGEFLALNTSTQLVVGVPSISGIRTGTFAALPAASVRPTLAVPSLTGYSATLFRDDFTAVDGTALDSNWGVIRYFGSAPTPDSTINIQNNSLRFHIKSNVGGSDYEPYFFTANQYPFAANRMIKVGLSLAPSLAFPYSARILVTNTNTVFNGSGWPTANYQALILDRDSPNIFSLTMNNTNASGVVTSAAMQESDTLANTDVIILKYVTSTSMIVSKNGEQLGGAFACTAVGAEIRVGFYWTVSSTTFGEWGIDTVAIGNDL